MFPRNCWYGVGWAHELTADNLLARQIAGEKVVAFRTAEGKACVMQDRCCHRHAPLSRGTLEPDGLRCGYHGMKFGADGRCIDVPGQDRIPETFRVKSYAVAEHKDFVFVWLGDPALADPSTLPDFYWHGSDDWVMRPGHIYVKANYQLIIDNVLDFSHIAWLHGPSFGTASAASAKGEVTGKDGGVELRYFYPNTPIRAFHTRLVGFEGPVDREHIINWRAPGFVYTSAKFWPAGHSDERPMIDFRTSHFLTPETESTTNYFWTHANRSDLASDEQMDLTYDVVTRAFSEEDRPMIEAQQTNICPEERMRGVYWDEAPTIARQEIDRLLAAEH